MSYQTMKFEVQDNVALVTFDRPEALNALNKDVLLECSDILDKIRADESIAVVVMTGAGEKSFISGADIKAMKEMNPLEGRNFSALGHEITLKIESLLQPVIAAVNGYALGGGTEMALAADFIYASEKAKFGQPEIGLGIIPGFGGTQRLPRRVGIAMAKELCMTGEMIDAQQALKIGLVNKVFPHDQLMEEAMKTARGMALKGRVTMRSVKRVIDRGIQVDLRTALALEEEAFGTICASVDHQEGLGAFIEKRKPTFKGTYNS